MDEYTTKYAKVFFSNKDGSVIATSDDKYEAPDGYIKITKKKALEIAEEKIAPQEASKEATKKE